MKIIFLDVDGVLNGINRWNVLGWKLVSLLHIKKLKMWYRKVTDPWGIHENKIKRLAKIVWETNAKIVLTSSWRNNVFYKEYHTMSDKEKKLIDAFHYYSIDLYDITPVNTTRTVEILQWLGKHESEVDNFIIIDDERLEFFVNDKRYIQTTSGLEKKHVEKAIKILLGKGIK